MKYKTILVTGAGYIGYILVNMLLKNYKVIALDRFFWK